MNGLIIERNVRSFNRAVNSVAALVTGACMILCVFYLLQPLNAETQTLRQQEAQVNSFFEKRFEVAETAEQLREQRTGYERRLETLLAGVPNSPQDSQFLGQIGKLARDSQFVLQQFRPGAIEKLGEYQQLTIEVTAQGTYTSICKFFAGLPSLPRLCRVTALNIHADAESGVFPVSLTLVIFYAPEDNSAGVANDGK